MITPFCQTCREEEAFGGNYRWERHLYCPECGVMLPERPPPRPRPPNECPECYGAGEVTKCDDSYSCFKWKCDACNGTGRRQ